MTTPQFFVCRLLPPRPTFAEDMTEAERAVMREHVEYWKGLAAQGKAVLFGPVMDPKGAWGIGIIEAPSESDVRAIQAADPAIKGALGLTYETLPMARAILRQGA